MPDFLDVLAVDAKATVSSGYYSDYCRASKGLGVGFRKSILQSKCVAVISEVKRVSPSLGVIRQSFAAEKVAQSMVRGGAVGISVLTEPKHFGGSLENLRRVRGAVDVPILMKDIVVSSVQVEAAKRLSADAVLLIMALFDRGYCEFKLEDMISLVHRFGLEVLLETHNDDEFVHAVKSKADLVGINNRDLGTLKVDLNVTKGILERNNSCGKIVVSESGISCASDVCFLRQFGAQAYLVGSAIMANDDVEGKVREFVQIP
jgi:indole-3-glycerol phosphate synthase